AMNTRTRLYRLLGAAVVTATCLRLVGCDSGGGGVVMGPKGGGRVPNPNSCFILASDAPVLGDHFRSARVSGNATTSSSPKKCPYVVDNVFQLLSVTLQIFIPAVNIDRSNSTIYFDGLRSRHDHQIVANAASRMWLGDPNNPDGLLAELTESYDAG